MGCLCNNRIEVLPKFKQIRNIEDLNITPGLFINLNTRPFHAVYQLHPQIIGSGSFGEIKLCTHRKTNQLRAVKIIQKETKTENEQEFLDEVEIYKELDHPNILMIYEFFEDEVKYSIVMEYCKDGDLLNYILSKGRLTEAEASSISEQILSGIIYMHSKNIIHRDLKPENILLKYSSEGELIVKIIDFDSASLFSETSKKGVVHGTLQYMAPEALKKKHSYESDLWSLGVILYVMLFGHWPFSGDFKNEIMWKIENGKFEFNPKTSISEEASNLIIQLLTLDTKQRISAKKAFEHPFFKKYRKKNIPEDLPHILLSISSICDSKLKQTLLTFIISQATPSPLIESLHSTFKALDMNGDGFISQEELVSVFEMTMNYEEALEESLKILTAVDTYSIGYISYSEFLRASLVNTKSLNHKIIVEAFHIFDREESGCISAEVLKNWLTLNQVISEEVFQELFLQNEMNEINEDQFEEFLNKLL